MGLKILNYKVFDVASGRDAVRQFNKQDGNFKLSIIDVELPDMHGPNVVKRFLLSKPVINILYISGYNEYKLKESFGLFDLKYNEQTLMKPFRLTDFIEKVKSMIAVDKFN